MISERGQIQALKDTFLGMPVVVFRQFGKVIDVCRLSDNNSISRYDNTTRRWVPETKYILPMQNSNAAMQYSR